MYLLSVIVCTYNRADLISKCLDSLVNQTLDKNEYEIIVINNNSTDETEQIVKRYVKNYSNLRLELETNQGLSYARNRGISEALGKYIAYIDDDAIAIENWCENIIKEFENVKPKPIVVGGMICPWYEATPPKWFKDSLEMRTWGTEKKFLSMPSAPYGFSGSNMAFQKEILIKYDGFCTKLGMNGSKIGLGEETELFMRIYRDSQLFWYNPEIKVFHYVPERNTKISYRFKRSYSSGITSIHLGLNKIGKYILIKSIIGLLYFIIIKGPLRVLASKEKLFSIIKYIEEVGYRIGRLSEMFKTY